MSAKSLEQKLKRYNALTQSPNYALTQNPKATEIFQIYSIGYPNELRGETACWGHYFNSLIVFFIITVR